MDIKSIREKYPQYADMSDKQLVDALHAKYYSDIPIKQFYATVGLTESKQDQSISVTTPHNNTQKTVNGTDLSNQGASTSDQQTQSLNQLYPGMALFDASIVVAFSFIIFFILTYGLIGKKKDSATKRGRWYGSIAVLLFLGNGGAKFNKYWSVEWLAATIGVSVLYFVIGYLIGITKWYLFDRNKPGTKEPPPFEYANDEHFDHKNTSQESSEGNKKSEAKTKKEHSYEERLNALRSNVAKCFAIIGLDEDALPGEIKAAFKRKMSSYHPDKVSGLGDKLKQVAEEETKLLNIAYQTLKKYGYC
ncbi:MAG: J domain-containing protein [Methylococcaceae bacterium]